MEAAVANEQATSMLVLDNVEIFVWYYPCSLDDVRAIRLAAQTLESSGVNSYGISFLTKRISGLVRPITQSFNYEISLQGSIPKCSYFTCVHEAAVGIPAVADTDNGILVSALAPVFRSAQYGSVG